MRMARFIPLLILGLAGAAAGSDDNTLLVECSEFVGLVNGVMGTNTLDRARQPETALFCPPDKRITNARAAKLVVDYVRSHPESRAHDPVSVVVFAFRAAFPCPAGQDH